MLKKKYVLLEQNCDALKRQNEKSCCDIHECERKCMLLEESFLEKDKEIHALTQKIESLNDLAKNIKGKQVHNPQTSSLKRCMHKKYDKCRSYTSSSSNHASSVICFYCNKKGHISKFCYKKKRPNVEKWVWRKKGTHIPNEKMKEFNSSKKLVDVGRYNVRKVVNTTNQKMQINTSCSEVLKYSKAANKKGPNLIWGPKYV